MGAPTNDRLGIVCALLETAPDAVVRDLDAALRLDTSSALAPVRAMVRAELSDRAVRDTVLAPVVPLCALRADGFSQALFPAGVLARLWKGLKQIEPRAVTVVASNLTLTAEDENFPPACDDLCRAAARAIGAGEPAMQAAILCLEEFRAGAAAQFASYLELVPLTRRAVRRLPAWLRNMSGEHAAAVRLLFRDADNLVADATPRLLELLLAHIADPWRLLRVISAVTNRGGDRYLSSSEMAEFCERVLADIDRRVLAVRLFDLDGGADAGRDAATDLAVAINEILEFEECLEIAKDGPWGQRIGKMKGALSSVTEGYLKKAPKIVGEALPMQQVRAGGVNLRMEPRLEHAPDPRLVQRAMAVLTFFERCRASASQGGYGSIRGRAGEEITHKLDTYIEDLLATIHGGGPENLDHARAFLQVAADFVGLTQDEKSAQIVRRRAAAAAAA